MSNDKQMNNNTMQIALRDASGYAPFAPYHAYASPSVRHRASRAFCKLTCKWCMTCCLRLLCVCRWHDAPPPTTFSDDEAASLSRPQAHLGPSQPPCSVLNTAISAAALQPAAAAETGAAQTAAQTAAQRAAVFAAAQSAPAEPGAGALASAPAAVPPSTRHDRDNPKPQRQEYASQETYRRAHAHLRPIGRHTRAERGHLARSGGHR